MAAPASEPRVVEGSPSTVPLMLKAALPVLPGVNLVPGVRKHGDTLPDLALTRHDVPVDRAPAAEVVHEDMPAEDVGGGRQQHSGRAGQQEDRHGHRQPGGQPGQQRRGRRSGERQHHRQRQQRPERVGGHS